MIIVIADDISGATELAGAATARGLTAEVHMRFNPASKADVIAIDTDTRACTSNEAALRVEQVIREALAFQPDWIYKKVDSVLRGHVVEELKAALATTDQSRALLVPANPGEGRVIREGTYYIDGKPLFETGFAMDPEHPVMDSQVVHILAASNDADVHPIGTLEVGEAIGVLIPDTTDRRELEALAAQTDADTLPAGGVAFFEALLESRCPVTEDMAAQKAATARINLVGPITGRKHSLFVCGSKAAWEAGREEEFSAHDIPVLTMPPEIFEADFSSHRAHEWAESVAGRLEANATVMVAIGSHGGDLPFAPNVLVRRMAEVIKEVMQIWHVDRLFMEGGATASALMHAVHWDQLSVLHRQLGVPTLRNVKGPGPELVIKPGSYPWPRAVWESIH